MKKEQIETNRISDEINKQKRDQGTKRESKDKKIGNEQSHGEQKKKNKRAQLNKIQSNTFKQKF